MTALPRQIAAAQDPPAPEAAREAARPALRKDVLWIAGGQVLAVVCALLSLRVWSTYLAPAEFGYMALVVTFASIMVGVVSGPMVQAIMVCFARHDADGQAQPFRAETSALLWRWIGIIAAVTVIAAWPVARITGLDTVSLLAIAPLFAIDTRREYERVLFSVGSRQRVVSLITTADVWARLIGVWAALALFEPSARIAILGNVVASAAVLGGVLMSRRVAWPPRQSPDAAWRQELRREISALALPLVPSSIFTNLTEMSSRYILGLTSGLHAAGLFVMGYGLVKRPFGMVRDVGAMVMLPLLSRTLVGGGRGEIRRVQALWLGSIAAVCIAGGLLFLALGDYIVPLLMTSVYAVEVIRLVPPLALGIGLFTIASVLDDFLLCERRSRAVLVNRAIAFVVSTALLLVMSRSYGLAGAAWSLVGGGVVHLLIATANVWRQPRRPTA